MAAAYRTSAAGGGSSGTSDRSFTHTPASGDLIVAFVNVSGNTNAAPSFTDSSGSYDLVGTALKNSSADMMSCFVRQAIFVGAPPSLTFTAVTGSNTAGQIVIVAISGMVLGGIAAIRRFASQANQAASGTPAPAFAAASLSENMTLSAVANGTAGGSVVVPNASWTERQDVSQASPTTGLEVNTRDSGFAGTTITFGGTSATAFASMAVELDGSVGPMWQRPIWPNTLLRM